MLLVSAKYGRGLGEARQAIRKALEPGPLASATPDPAGASPSLEQRLALVDGELPQRMAAILAATVQLPPQWRDRLTRRLDRVLLHPLLGLPLFFAMMLLMFQGIYAIGVPVQGLLSSWLSQFGQGVL
ncbi:MAG: ferrous iron transport protein, partial [Cyanobacteriota bacterium]